MDPWLLSMYQAEADEGGRYVHGSVNVKEAQNRTRSYVLEQRHSPRPQDVYD